MRLPLSLSAHAVRADAEMSVRVLFSRLVVQGKRVFQKAVKATQNKPGVKVAQNKPALGQQREVAKHTTGQLQPLWNRLIPRVSYRTLAAELRKRAAWNAGAPFVAFLGLSLVQNEQQEQIVEEICELVKGERQTQQEPSLFDKVREINLDQLEIGRLIGKGCNAAVHEARLKTPIHDDVETVVTSDDEASSDASNDIVGAIDQIDELLEALDETAADTVAPNSSDNNRSVIDDFTETGSDITVLDMSDDDISDDEAAPTMFLVQSVIEKVPYLSAVERDVDMESNASFEVIDLPDDIDESIDETNQEHEELTPLTMTCSRILLSLPGPARTEEEARNSIDGVEDSDMEYESMDSTVPGENAYDSTSGYNLAVKMMFNYGLDSNAAVIFEGMQKEAVPARLMNEAVDGDYLQNGHKVRKKLPPHPNIVEMLSVFVDEVSHLPESFEDYPDALPKRINPSGIGRNMTMYLVMKKYDCTLKEYLSNNSPSFHERLCLFAQLLEAIVHLQNHGIAHRDIKSNNILLDCSQEGVPKLVLSDFGCCLADEQNGLKIPYVTDAISKDGNMALMAPEILNAQPGPYSVLDYTKADLWATGALAYEIFGGDNPFYSHLSSSSYREEDLPPLSDQVPVGLRSLITQMLKTNPYERPTPTFASNVVSVLLWMPDDWSLLSDINHMICKKSSDWEYPGNNRKQIKSGSSSFLQLKCKQLKSEIKLWTAILAIEVLFNKTHSAEHMLKRNFISRLTTRDILGVLNFLNINVMTN